MTWRTKMRTWINSRWLFKFIDTEGSKPWSSVLLVAQSVVSNPFRLESCGCKGETEKRWNFANGTKSETSPTSHAVLTNTTITSPILILNVRDLPAKLKRLPFSSSCLYFYFVFNPKSTGKSIGHMTSRIISAVSRWSFHLSCVASRISLACDRY